MKRKYRNNQFEVIPLYNMKATDFSFNKIQYRFCLDFKGDNSA